MHHTRLSALSVASASGLVLALLPAVPAHAADADAQTAAAVAVLDQVATWSAGLDDESLLGQPVPLVSVAPGTALDLGSLGSDAFATVLPSAGSWATGALEDFAGLSGSFDLGDGRRGSIAFSVDDSAVAVELDATVTLADESFTLDSTEPKLSLATDGGVPVEVTFSLDLTVVTEEVASDTWAAYVASDSTSEPLIGSTVSVGPLTSDLAGAVGILGVDIAATDLALELSFTGSITDPDEDGRLYFDDPTTPAPDDGELGADGSATGLVTVDYGTERSASGSFAVSAAPASGTLDLPGIDATVSFDWPDLTDDTALAVTASGFEAVQDFLTLSNRDLADGLGTLTSAIAAFQRASIPGGDGNLDLPFMQGTLADAAQVNEGLRRFLEQNTVQPPADDAGAPLWTSLQDLLDRLDGATFADLPGAEITVAAGTYDTASKQLPLTLTLARSGSGPVPLYDPEIEYSGPTATYSDSAMALPSPQFDGVDLAGRRVVAGTSSGTVLANDATTITLTSEWVGGAPADGTPWAITAAEPQTGLVELASVLADGDTAINNATALAPTADVTPSYEAIIGIVLDLSPGTIVDPPVIETNPDGSTWERTEDPIGIERILLDPSSTQLWADLPISTAVDAFGRAGFLSVRVGGTLSMDTASGSAHMVQIDLLGSDLIGFTDLFAALTDTSGPGALLDIEVGAQASASGSVSVPGAASFLPGGATLDWTITCADIADAPDSCVVDATDLAELFAVNIETDNPQALLGVLISTLESLDVGLLGGSGLAGDALESIPVLNVDVKDLLSGTESGGGPGVVYGNAGEYDPGDGPISGLGTLTDSQRGTPFGQNLVGRSMVVGTAAYLVLAVDGSTLVLDAAWPDADVPGTGTPYAFRSELRDAIDALVASPPDTLQDALALVNPRLQGSGLAFRYDDIGSTPTLVLDLAWDRDYTATRPVRLDFAAGGDDYSLAGIKGAGSATIEVDGAVDVGLAVPLTAGDGPSGPGQLQVLDDSSIALGVTATAGGSLLATLGPLSLALGNPEDGAPAAETLDLAADLQVGLAKPGGSATATSSLTDFLGAIDLGIGSDGAECRASTDVVPDLVVCADAPLFYSLDGTTFSELPLTTSAIRVRLPESATVADSLDVTGPDLAVDGGGTVPRLEYPDPTELADLLAGVQLDFSDLASGLDAYLALIEQGLVLASADGRLPLVGSDLQQGAAFVGDARQAVGDAFATLPNGGKVSVGEFETFVDDTLEDALGVSDGAVDVAATCGTLAPVSGVAVTATDDGDDGTTTWTYTVVAYTGEAKTPTTFALSDGAVNDATLDADNFNTIDWDPNPNASGYFVLRSTDAGATWEQVADIADDSVAQLVDNGLTGSPAPSEPADAPVVADCSDADPATVEGVAVTFDLQQGTPSDTGCTGDCLTTTVPLDIGVPGLALRADRQDPDAGLAVKLGYDIHFAVALTRDDGFVVLADDEADPEVRLGLGIGITDVGGPDVSDLTAELAIVRVDLTKNGTEDEFVGLFSVDVTGGTITAADLISDPLAYVDPELTANAQIDWFLEATVDSALPGISTTFVLDWSFSATDPSDTSGFTTVAFNDVRITYGAFLQGVLGPVLKEVKRVTGPLDPVIETLYTPIPVLTDLSKLAGGDEVTIVSLASTFSTLAGGPDLTFVENAVEVLALVKRVTDFANDDPTAGIPIGDFALSPDAVVAAEATPDRAADLVDSGTITNQQADVTDDIETTGGEKPVASDGAAASAGFAFPVLEDTTLLFGLLVNQDVDIVTWDSGPLVLEFSWKQTFGPVYAPPPVMLNLSGAAGVEARVILGFDTFGIRKAFEAGIENPVSSVSGIVQGLYLGTTDPATGQPVPVLTFYGQIAAGASVSAVIIEVGIEGGFRLTVSFSWRDPNADGKFRITEFVAVALNNPICLFTTGGALSLFLKVFVTLGFSPFSVSFDFTLANVKLLDFSIEPDCEPPPPKLADVDGSILYVFAGTLGNDDLRGAPWGNDGEASPDVEKIKVYSLHYLDGEADSGDFDGFAVEGFGEYQVYEDSGLATVVVDARSSSIPLELTFLGDGDKNSSEEGAGNSGTAEATEFEKDVVVLGSDGPDTIKAGTGNAWIDGRGENDVITVSQAADRTATVAGGPGADSITVGNGDAIVAGDSALGLGSATGTVTLNGRDGDASKTTVVDPGAIVPPSGAQTGSDGKDRIALGLGQNTVFGNGEDDSVGVAADIAGSSSKGNEIVGGHGSDQIAAGSAADTIWTGLQDDIGPDEAGSTDPDPDGPDGLAQNTVDTGTGNDTVYGSQGRDTVQSQSLTSQKARIFGGGNEDVLAGGYGGDEIYGGPGDDYVLAEPTTVGPPTGTGDFGPIREITRVASPESGTSRDRLVGGTGNDHVIGGDGGADIWGDAYLPAQTCAPGDPVRSDPVSETDDPNDGRDLILGGGGVDIASGGGKDDRMRLFGADDLGCGQRGDDDLSGGDDADQLWGGTGDDLGKGGTGDDDVYGNAGADTLYGESGEDVLEGNDGVDTVFGGTEVDLVLGGTRAAGRSDAGDTLYGQGGRDVVIGDNGTVDASAPIAVTWRAADARYGPLDLDGADANLGGPDTIWAGGDDDVAYGGLDDDTVYGSTGEDHLEGNNGSDTVRGGSQDDEIVGGSYQVAAGAGASIDGRPDADDTLFGDDGADIVLGDNGYLQPDSAQPTPLLSGRDNAEHSVTLYDLGASPIPGTSGDDRVFGGPGQDALLGQGGQDYLRGDDGDDAVEGGPGTDRVEGNSGDDDLVGGSTTPFGSAIPGSGDTTSTGQPDDADEIWGGDDDDVALGDNGAILRGTGVRSAVTNRNGSVAGLVTLREIIRYDLDTLDETRSGRDEVSGGDGVDILYGQDEGDYLTGGPGEDHVQGNGESDLVRGDASLTVLGSSDIVAPGLAGWPGLPTGVVPTPASDRDGTAPPGQDDLIGGSDVVGHRDAGDWIEGNDAADVALGDNGSLLRDPNGTGGIDRSEPNRYPDGTPAGSQFRVRLLDPALGFPTTRFCEPAATTCEASGAWGGDQVWGGNGDDRLWGQDGDDIIDGGPGDDDLVGETGDDVLLGQAGDDGLLGDRGGIIGEYIDTEDEGTFTTTLQSVPKETYVGLPVGSLDRRVDLLADVEDREWVDDVPLPGQDNGGRDRLRGGDDNDVLFGGAGDDLANGDAHGDSVFGGNGTDALWGGYGDPAGGPGRGADDEWLDRVFGGASVEGSGDDSVAGADIIDWNPRGSYDTPGTTCTTAPFPEDVPGTTVDPCDWFEMTDKTAAGSVGQHHQGTDWIYGGWDRDVMQGDESENGPNPGDRLIDWNGAYNLYSHCNAAYGGFNDVRQHSPAMQAFLQQLAYASGAGRDADDSATAGTSAFVELALTYPSDNRPHGSGKAFPTTPGHFDDPAACPVAAP
jgi:Ca2+-binding RTX toxin-like protein